MFCVTSGLLLGKWGTDSGRKLLLSVSAHNPLLHSHSLIVCSIVGRKARALYACKAEHDSELSFIAGTVFDNGESRSELAGGKERVKRKQAINLRGKRLPLWKWLDFSVGAEFHSEGLEMCLDTFQVVEEFFPRHHNRKSFNTIFSHYSNEMKWLTVPQSRSFCKFRWFCWAKGKVQWRRTQNLFWCLLLCLHVSFSHLTLTHKLQDGSLHFYQIGHREIWILIPDLGHFKPGCNSETNTWISCYNLVSYAVPSR